MTGIGWNVAADWQSAEQSWLAFAREIGRPCEICRGRPSLGNNPLAVQLFAEIKSPQFGRAQLNMEAELHSAWLIVIQWVWIQIWLGGIVLDLARLAAPLAAARAPPSRLLAAPRGSILHLRPEGRLDGWLDGRMGGAAIFHQAGLELASELGRWPWRAGGRSLWTPIAGTMMNDFEAARAAAWLQGCGQRRGRLQIESDRVELFRGLSCLLSGRRSSEADGATLHLEAPGRLGSKTRARARRPPLAGKQELALAARSKRAEWRQIIYSLELVFLSSSSFARLLPSREPPSETRAATRALIKQANPALFVQLSWLEALAPHLYQSKLAPTNHLGIDLRASGRPSERSRLSLAGEVVTSAASPSVLAASDWPKLADGCLNGWPRSQVYLDTQ